VRVVRDLPCGEPVWVAADATQLQQVVINLAVNARDAMPDGGELRLTLRREWRGGEPGHGGREMAALVVTDCGNGMSDEIRERVTEPFFTTKPRERGTGLRFVDR